MASARRNVGLWLAARRTTTRGELVAKLDEELKRTGMSHLRSIGPAKGMKIFAAAATPAGNAPPAVSTTLRGKVAAVRISTFLVPAITERLVRDAMRAAEAAGAVAARGLLPLSTPPADFAAAFGFDPRGVQNEAAAVPVPGPWPGGGAGGQNSLHAPANPSQPVHARPASA